MYNYVKDKEELAELKRACECIIKRVQKSELRNYFTFQFNLIGSGKYNLITQNGDGEYDLDYNFILQKDKKDLFSNPERIKELFINAFNEVNPDLGFEPTENSTSVITSKLIYENRLHFSFDVAILCEGYNGNYLKIVFNKPTGQYYWNEIKSSKNYQTKIEALKAQNAWGEARKIYIDKKNRYLSQQNNRSSFSILLETLNELCSKYRICV